MCASQVLVCISCPLALCAIPGITLCARELVLVVWHCQSIEVSFDMPLPEQLIFTDSLLTVPQSYSHQPFVASHFECPLPVPAAPSQKVRPHSDEMSRYPGRPEDYPRHPQQVNDARQRAINQQMAAGSSPSLTGQITFSLFTVLCNPLLITNPSMMPLVFLLCKSLYLYFCLPPLPPSVSIPPSLMITYLACYDYAFATWKLCSVYFLEKRDHSFESCPVVC